MVVTLLERTPLLLFQDSFWPRRFKVRLENSNHTSTVDPVPVVVAQLCACLPPQHSHVAMWRQVGVGEGGQ